MASWLFLTLSLMGAVLAFNVYRPRSRAGPQVAFLSFFVGWLTGELAIHHIFWQGVVTVILIGFGALEGTPGRIGLAVTLLSWLALGAHYLRGFGVGTTMEDALREAFGADYRERIEPEQRRTLSTRIEWGPILAPFPIRSPNTERIRDIRYGRASAIDLKLDVYRHRSHPERCPVFFYVHGGGWVIGTKNTQGLPLVTHMASRGWLCVNVNYRLSPHATFPDHLVDLKRAIAWVREKGPAFGADPDLIVVSGGSAGGHLAALLALTGNDPEYQPGFEEVDTRVQGCIPIYGVYDFTDGHGVWHNDGLQRTLERHVLKTTRDEDPEAFDKASPILRIDSDAPPFLVVHGEMDSLVPVKEARIFVETFRRRASAPIAYAEIRGAQHAFELFPSLRSQLARQGMERFLAILESETRERATRQDNLEATG